MIICSRCGYENEDSATFCAEPSCNNYLRWEAEADTGPVQQQAAPTPPSPTPPTTRRLSDQGPAPGGGQAKTETKERQGVQLSLPQEQIYLEAGGQTEIEVHIRNTGTINDEFVIDVIGAPAVWATVDPPSIALWKGAAETVRIVFAPPRAPDTPSGHLPFTVRATSKVNPAITASEAWTITVGGFRELAADLTPDRVSARGAGTFRFSVVNAGSLPVAAAVHGTDANDAVDFEVSPEVLELPPNHQDTAVVKVRPRKRLWFGQQKTYPFEVLAQPDEGAVAQEDEAPLGTLKEQGTLVQLPLIPRWGLYAAGALIGLAMAGIALFGGQQSQPPTSDISAAGPLAPAPAPGGVPLPGPGGAPPGGAPPGGAPPGGAPAPAPPAVPGTTPQSPAPPPAGGGSSPAPQPAGPVPVPDVSGRDFNSAATEIQGKGLTVQQATERSNSVPNGRVIRTAPPSGQQAPPGSAVTVVVSSGPTPVFDMTTQARGATWRNGAGLVQFGGGSRATGMVIDVTNAPLTTGTASRGVAMLPPTGGVLQGDYTLPSPIIAGDRFTAQVGFTAGQSSGAVQMQVMVTDPQGRSCSLPNAVFAATTGAPPPTFNVDLTPCAGAQIVSLVVADFAQDLATQDQVVWIEPTIQGGSA